MSQRTELKKALRIQYKRWMRDNITPAVALANGEQILLKFQALQRVHPLCVSVFVSKCPEISTFPLINWLFDIGAQVHLPAWHDNEMWMCAIGSKGEFETLIASTPTGKIPMPLTDRVEIKDFEYDWIIVPGLVFDERKHRLGYGYGHYDYFLSRYFAHFDRHIGKVKLIGVAHDDQVHREPLPFEEHDIQLDHLITPNKTL